jgi:hypothetical protein
LPPELAGPRSSPKEFEDLKSQIVIQVVVALGRCLDEHPHQPGVR